MTGRFLPSRRPRVKAFRTRQSSPAGLDGPPAPALNSNSNSLLVVAAPAPAPGPPPLGQLGPHSRQSRTPGQGCGLTGGMKRFAPAVDAPYGIPLKTYTPLWLTPRTLPWMVSATGSLFDTATPMAGATIAPPIASEPREMNCRRSMLSSPVRRLNRRGVV